jgi:type II secretory pathway pseudopilin PulG
LFPLIITLVVIALVIAAIVSIGRAVFNSSDDAEETTTSQADQRRQALVATDQSRSVHMTVRGPIVADENFKSYRITASPSERSMDVFDGYLEDRTGGKTLGNNTRAYEQFVYALDKANMMNANGRLDDEGINDLRGICANGYVYEYTVLNNSSEVAKLWTSSCDGSPGTLDASVEQLSDLFIEQVPGSEDMIPFRRSPSLRF